MNNLVTVAEAILDATQSECLQDNIESVETIEYYAWNALEILLSDSECEKVLEVCRAASVEGAICSQKDYELVVLLPLQQFPEAA